MAEYDSFSCPHVRFINNRFGAGAPIQTIVDAAAQCIECNVLLQAVSAFKPGWVEANKGGTCHIYVEKKKTYTVKLLSEPSTDELIGSFQLFHRSKDEPMYEPEESGSESILRRPRAQALEIIRDSSSKAALERAAQWLSYCLEHDEACEVPNADFMPRLLMNVDSQVSGEPFLFRPTQIAPYACLSYCWGSDTEGILQTTTENLESHFKSIPLSQLPLGIQDAITVCRGLNIHNLWVDSLCIVQDDPVAWLEDASQMDRIYLHSLLTIAALEPTSCNSRFLGAQNFAHPNWQCRFVADITQKPDESPLEVFVRPKRAEDQEDKEEDTKRSLDKRGWCLQESLLPSRRLCFNGDEMSWECLCRTVCECGHILWRPQPFGFARLGAHLKSKRLKAEVVVSHPQPARPWHEEYHGYNYWRRGDGYPETPYRRWRDIVTEYSQRTLSRRKDRLSAVSGLAKLVREGLPGDQQGRDASPPDEYLAGLWRREFHFDLSWVVTQPAPESIKGESALQNEKEREAEKFRIPSWSWAAVDVPVSYSFDKELDLWKYKPKLIDCVKVESVSCQRELIHDETSTVISGKAVMTGLASPMELAVIIGSEGRPKSVVRSTNLHAVEVTLDQQKGLTHRPGDAQEDCWKANECQRGDNCCKWKTDRGNAIKGQDDELLGLVLFSWIAPTSKTDFSGKMRTMGPDTWFLVLKPSSSSPGAYERIGIGMCSGYNGERAKLFREAVSVTVEVV
ncbi:heterokaryon incompatibility [Trichoderma arundinaceum]|uniref:Heterokaryon incompatibility n=1 Tax=Trichoderma arundinaceum TaxID=490622 RepID=A0A395P1D1_TRIAR|nr:heterokaryon incompatibility [Trichoderma arundinaceum]